MNDLRFELYAYGVNQMDVRLQKMRIGKYPKNLVFVLSFFFLAICWAIVSPFGSSADDDYHLASIYCLNQNIDVCKVDRASASATIDGAAVKQPDKEKVVTTHFNIAGSRPQVYYYLMSRVVTEDVYKSALLIRAINAIIASLILLLATSVSPKKVNSALKVSWGICIAPVGIFYIVSANPSSWAIVSVGTFWAFAMASYKVNQGSKKARTVAKFGMLLTLLLALSSRNEAGLYIIFTLLAVLIASSNFKNRPTLKQIAPYLLLGGFGVIVSIYFVLRRFIDNLKFVFLGDYLNQDPNPLLNSIIEFPRFISSHFGGQVPWFQGNYTYTAGVGWLNFQLPSMTGILTTAAIGGTLLISFSHFSIRRVVSTLYLWLAFAVITIGSLAMGGFDRTLALQPRYTLPILLAIIGLSIMQHSGANNILQKPQAIIISILIWLSSVAAWQRTATFYSNELNAFWMDLYLKPVWWWNHGPSKNEWLALTMLATLCWVMASIATSETSKELPEKKY